MKSFLFFLSQAFFYFTSTLLRRRLTETKVDIRISVNGHSICSGYYDRCNVINNELIFNAVKITENWAIHPKQVQIRSVHLDLRKHSFIAKTSCFNWQGSSLSVGEGMLSFVDTSDEGDFVTRILDQSSHAEKFVLPFGTWKVDFNRRIAFSIDYEALYLNRPGYGYEGNTRRTDKSTVGVFDIKNKQFIHRTSLRDLGFDPDEGFYFNHIIINNHLNEFITLVCREGPERVIKPYRINFQTGLISEIKFEGLFSHASFVDTGNIVYFGKKNGVSGYILHCLESSQTTMLYETCLMGTLRY